MSSYAWRSVLRPVADEAEHGPQLGFGRLAGQGADVELLDDRRRVGLGGDQGPGTTFPRGAWR